MLRPQCVVERIRSRLSWCSCIRLFAAGAVVYATAALNLNADEKPQPRIALCSPLGLSRGSTTKVVLRGWALEEVSDVHASDASITIKLLSKGNAPLPNQQDAAKIGDRQLELEITVPSEISVSETRLTLVTNDPMPPSCVLLIGGRYPVVSEAEPNDGFREAQLLAFPQIVDGVIEADRKVDVFSFSLPMPQRVTMTLEARSFGSGLDSILAVYDERGRRLIENDDQVNSTDSKLERMLPAGRYFVVVQDALDRGGPAHPYRLTLASSE